MYRLVLASFINVSREFLTGEKIYATLWKMICTAFVIWALQVLWSNILYYSVKS